MLADQPVLSTEMSDPTEKTPPTHIEISKPNVGYIPQLLELWKEQYDYHHQIDPAYYVPYSESLRATVENHLRELFEDRSGEHILVARTGTSLVGFITFDTGTESYFDTNITKYGEIKELLVKSSARGQGVGKALIRKVEGYFRSQNLTHVKIQLSSFNSTALAVYEKNGYTSRQQLLYKEL